MKLRLAAVAAFLIVVASVFTLSPRFLRDGDERPAPQASARASAASQVQVLEQRVSANPADVEALTQLASAYLSRARETADPAFYGLADTAVSRALAAQPDNVQALVVGAGVALARHDFLGALMLGERAKQIAPDVAAVYAVITDASVELGRYEDAAIAAQTLADMKPGFAAYSRTSYLRELHGDIDGAIESMELAAEADTGTAYDTVWARVIIGNLQLVKGDVNTAAAEYQRAAALSPEEPVALFGLARLALARGDLAGAEAHLRVAADRRPLPEYVILLGDVLEAQGKQQEADQQFALVGAIQQLFSANGVDTDVELALFDADHGVDPAGRYAKALAAYKRRPSVTAADAVAWSAYKAGMLDEARAYSERALRLDSRDPLLLFRAGIIEQAVGDIAAARTHLIAASRSPGFSVRYAPMVGAGLAGLEGAATTGTAE